MATGSGHSCSEWFMSATGQKYAFVDVDSWRSQLTLSNDRRAAVSGHPAVNT
ncbi:UNVERIFIED_ORG: hypothetical protein J2Y81_006128 [Paraburkholderia sediminicola]|nr:hypothetical protein [Paraburkholderia sediminicola]